MKHPNKIIALDCDGVLAQFTEAIIDRLNEIHGEDFHDIEDVKNWDIYGSLGVPGMKEQIEQEHSEHPNLARTLLRYPHALNLVDDLRTLADVHIVTASYEVSRTWERDRQKWLQNLFSFDTKHIHFTNRKDLFRADVLIDDGPHNIEAWPGDAVIVDRPWNRGLDSTGNWLHRGRKIRAHDKTIADVCDYLLCTQK